MKRALCVTILPLLVACGGSGGPTSVGNGEGGAGGGGGGGGGGGSSVNRTIDTVFVGGISFSPSSLTVARGRTVVWFQTDGEVHTVTPTGHAQWTSVTTSGSGEVLRVTFNTAGTFNYLCTPHQPFMVGRITVQ